MNNSDILRHVKTHSKRSAEDEAAVSILKSFLRSGGRINPNFASNDKWPNSDGTFEFVSNPDNSRIPEQNFFVQIKGTSYYRKKKEGVSYSLQSLAFPATVASRVSLDPGILFVVLNPEERGEERVFWKYMSVEYVNSIDYTKDSCTVQFTWEEEIKNTEEYVCSDAKSTRISFDVCHFDHNVTEDKEEWMKMHSVVPFQLAYAISIHKAQGLEYDSVKVVIPDSNSERITHGIFYTAVTRAKRKLKIYWSSETMQEIVQRFSGETSREKSLEIIREKLVQ